MNRATLASLLGVVVAFGVATRLEPPLGRGLVAGALLAASVGLAGIGTQLYVARRSPKKLMLASVANFGLILAAVLIGALLLRYVPAIADAADYRGFLVGFAGLGFLLLVLGSLDVASVLKQGSPL